MERLNSTFSILLLLAINFQSAIIAQNKSNKLTKKEATFFIEIQPDSPILIRDLSAKILPKNRFSESKIEVIFYVTNKSEKKIEYYGIQTISNNICGEYEGTSGGELLPNESKKISYQYPLGTISEIYRINDVRFEDKTKWTSKCLVSSKKMVSKGVKPTKAENSPKPSMILRREFQTSPFFSDKILNVIEKEIQTIEELEIKIKKHELKTLRFDMIESCNSEINSFEIAYNEHDFDVDEILSYEFNGKIFAYNIPYQFITDEGFEIGAGSASIFVDEKGDGIFKLQCNEQDNVFWLKTVPKWIKDSATVNK